MLIKENDTPTKITPCPIIEGLIEIKFTNTLEKNASDAVFGIIYDKIKDSIDGVEKLPILQFPEEIRSIDPGLMYSPYYKLKPRDTGGNLLIQIGPRVITFNCTREYIGWTNFYSFIKQYFDVFIELGIIKQIDKYGVRYINFFNENIFEKIRLQIDYEGKPLECTNKDVRFTVLNSDFSSKINIANNASFVINGVKSRGSVIDINTSFSKPFELSDEVFDIIEESHAIVKKEFFKLLIPEYIETLEPVYKV